MENEWTKVYETELDFQYVALTQLRDPVLKDLVPMSKSYIYEFGGSFCLNKADKTNNFSAYQANEKCVNELFSYLKRELKEGESIEIYSCWDSEEELPISNKVVINLSTFKLGETFVLKERHFIKFVKE